MKRSTYLLGTVLLLVGLPVHADDYAQWQSGTVGDWHVATNWADVTDAPLPAPGYPTTNYDVWIGGGYVTISSQNVTVTTLQLKSGSILIVTNGVALTVTNSMNYQAASGIAGYIQVPNGYVDILNPQTGTVSGLYCDLGTNGSPGHLDLGATWGTTNGYPSSFGILDHVLISLANRPTGSDRENRK